jgi:hypothetical protein
MIGVLATNEDEGSDILLVVNWFAQTANSREHTGFILFCGTQKLQYLSDTMGFILLRGTQKLQYSSDTMGFILLRGTQKLQYLSDTMGFILLRGTQKLTIFM